MRTSFLIAGLALVLALLLHLLNSAHASAPDALHWRDPARLRDLHLQLHPAVTTAAPAPRSIPLILYRSDDGADPDAGARWAQAWAARGYTVLRLQPDPEPRPPTGATLEHLLGPADDFRYLLDELQRQQATATAPAWVAALDLQRIAAAGHGFGAQLIQTLAGQRHPGPIKSLHEPRLRAFIALSPLVQGQRKSWPERYNPITAPFLTISGSWDGAFHGRGLDPLSKRRPLHHHLNPERDGHTALLWLQRGDHALLSGHPQPDRLPPSRLNRQRSVRTPAALRERQARLIEQLSADFLDAHLRDDPAARQRLHDGPDPDRLRPLGHWQVD